MQSRVKQNFTLLKFLKFSLVGGSGALLHLGITWVLTEWAGWWYMASMLVAIVFVVTWNFSLNALWTFALERDTNTASYDWHSYYNGNFIQKWWKHRVAAEVWRAIPNSSSLLDVGCGSSPIIAKYPNAVGIDVNKDKLEFIKEKVPTITTRKMSADNLEYDDESFDYVLCIEVVEHLKEYEKAIAEIARVLKQGGKALIATPDYNRKHWYLFEMFTAYKEEHISKFHRKKLERICAKYGLVPMSYRYVAHCDLVETFYKPYKPSQNGHYTNLKPMQMAKVATKVIGRMAKPCLSKVTFMLTYRCNHRCVTCNIWQHKLVDGEISPEELELILSKNKIIWGSFTGGEVFLRGDIGDMLSIGAKHLDVVSVTSNGSRPFVVEGAIRQMLSKSNSIVAISISLEGDYGLHDSFTRVGGSYERAIETIKRLNMIKCSRLKVGIERLISGHTYGGDNHVKDIANQLGVGITYTLEQRAQYYDNIDNDIEHNALPKQKLELGLLNLANYMFIRKATNGYRVKCVAGSYSCFISPECVVYPCMFKIPTNPLVSLRHTDYVIGDINSKSKEIVDKCEGCWTPCESYTTLIFRPLRLL